MDKSEAPDTNGDSYCRHVYERLSTDRDPYLDRARLVAKLTIPWLLPDAGTTSATRFPDPFQNLGARGVNNLAAKLLLVLFPPNAPFFEFRVEPYALETITGVKNAEDEVKKNLIKASEAILSRLETDGFRVAAHEALLHLVVTGNALIKYGKDGVRVFHLDQFVVERDPVDDHPMILMVHEKISRRNVPQSMLQPNTESSILEGTGASSRLEKTVDLFTHCDYDRESKTWECYQEIAGKPVPGSAYTVREDQFEFIVLRGNKISGENYGRGYVDDHYGDLRSLEGLAQAIVENAAACARLLFAVNPNGMMDADEISKKPNGAFIDGRGDDIQAVRVDKFSDMQVAGRTAEALKSDLSFAFLLNSAVQRNAERVTAEEVRFMAEELEQALGGVYTLFSREFQLPVVTLLMTRMQAANQLPKISKKFVRPSVVTGIEALGRGNDLNRLRAAMGALVEMVGPQVAASMVNPPDLAQRVFNAAGVRSDGLVRTQEQIAAEQRAAQQAELMSKGIGPGITQLGGAVRESLAGQASGAVSPQ